MSVATPVRPQRKNSGRKKKARKLAGTFSESSQSTSYVASVSDESEEESPQTSAARSLAFMNTQSSSLATPSKQSIQVVGSRLRNVLKLPKAYRWCCYEWFYSTLDRPLFDSDNDDFSCLLKVYFPNLKTRNLTKAQWGQIRRLMGKPRRCSASFLQQERKSLAHKRQQIRQLQMRKMTDVEPKVRELPAEIPMPLTIGTKVTAWLHDKPKDQFYDLFCGQIEALDLQNEQYRIRFERQGLGTHNVADIDVWSSNTPETMSVQAILDEQMRQRKLSAQFSPGFTPPRLIPGTTPLGGTPGLTRILNDPLMGVSPCPQQDMLGGFPTQFLKVVAQLSKILAVKKMKIQRLQELNAEAERLDLVQQPRTAEYQKQYASVLLDLETINAHLNQTLSQVQQWCSKLNPVGGVTTRVTLAEHCQQTAEQLVRSMNGDQSAPRVKSQRALQLITQLMSVLLQLKAIGDNGSVNVYELGRIVEALQKIKKDSGIISPCNVSLFENSVEVHIHHILSGLSRIGNLYCFNSAQLNPQPLAM